MSEPQCECPGPGFCDRYKVRQGPFAHAMCRGDNCTPRRSEAFRLKLRERAGKPPLVSLPTVKAVSRPKRVPLVLRPPCVHQGSEVPGCKTCGGEGSIIRYCDSPDDEADRCVRGKSRDPSVRSCLICDHYSPGGITANTACTATPLTSR